MDTYTVIAVAALGVGVMIALLRRPGVFKRIIGAAALGFGALAIVNLTSSMTGVGLAVSTWTIAVAGILGLPGVASMILLKIFWQI